jgi:glycosyltransferase involved in cell wall biosynthesis
MNVTVLIATKDEALHIARCVRSVRELGRVVIVDSFSEDGTAEIARAEGAEVVEHLWTGYAEQKNWALDNVGIETEWVLFLDADETLPPSSVAEIQRVVAGERTEDGYLLARRQIFLGGELKHAWWYPDYQLRLWRTGKGRFESRRVHEHPIVDGEVGTLSEPLLHENLKGLNAFIERHNRYSDLEVDELLSPSAGLKRGSFRGGWADRRRALKYRVWYRLPGRPVVRFFWLYVVKRGFLDGRRGFVYSTLVAMYDLMIELKLTERRLTGTRPPSAPGTDEQ